jgi:hypothetical protein
MNDDGQNFAEKIERLTQERNHEQQTCQIWKRRTEQYREDYENAQREHAMKIAHMKHAFSETKERARHARVEAWTLRNANAGLRVENEGFRVENEGFRVENEGFRVENERLREENKDYNVTTRKD